MAAQEDLIGVPGQGPGRPGTPAARSGRRPARHPLLCSQTAASDEGAQMHKHVGNAARTFILATWLLLLAYFVLDVRLLPTLRGSWTWKGRK